MTSTALPRQRLGIVDVLLMKQLFLQCILVLILWFQMLVFKVSAVSRSLTSTAESHLISILWNGIASCVSVSPLRGACVLLVAIKFIATVRKSRWYMLITLIYSWIVLSWSSGLSGCVDTAQPCLIVFLSQLPDKVINELVLDVVIIALFLKYDEQIMKFTLYFLS